MPPVKGQKLGQLIQRHRDAKGLSLRALAREAGLDYSWLSRIEQGEIATPAPQRLQRLARALDLDIEELYGLSGYAVSDRLPEFDTYLRAKYDLPDQAVNQLDEYFQMLRDKYGPAAEDTGDG
jgi:transcriptional regulator with XRE-family HTH domain